METYVIDTSVVLKWFNQKNESHVKIAHQIYKDMLDNKIVLVVPNLMVIEIVNALKKGKNMPLVEIKRIIDDFFSLPLIIKESSQAIFEQTAEAMETYNIAAYDALFVAEAKDSECRLISDDTKAHGKITNGTVIMLEDYKSP